MNPFQERDDKKEEIVKLRGDFNDCNAERARWRAEAEQLRRDLEIWRRNGGEVLQRAEIERLRVDLRLATDTVVQLQREIERLQNDKAELLALLIPRLKYGPSNS